MNNSNNTTETTERPPWLSKYASNWGKKFSRETKKRMSEAHDDEKIPVVAYRNGKLVGKFESQAAAAKALGVRQGNVFNVLNGKQRSTGGYTFRFAKKGGMKK